MSAVWTPGLPLGHADDSPCADSDFPQSGNCQVAEVVGVESAVDNTPVSPSVNEAMASLDAEGL